MIRIYGRDNPVRELDTQQSDQAEPWLLDPAELPTRRWESTFHLVERLTRQGKDSGEEFTVSLSQVVLDHLQE